LKKRFLKRKKPQKKKIIRTERRNKMGESDGERKITVYRMPDSTYSGSDQLYIPEFTCIIRKPRPDTKGFRVEIVTDFKLEKGYQKISLSRQFVREKVREAMTKSTTINSLLDIIYQIKTEKDDACQPLFNEVYSALKGKPGKH